MTPSSTLAKEDFFRVSFAERKNVRVSPVSPNPRGPWEMGEAGGLTETPRWYLNATNKSPFLMLITQRTGLGVCAGFTLTGLLGPGEENLPVFVPRDLTEVLEQ